MPGILPYAPLFTADELGAIVIGLIAAPFLIWWAAATIKAVLNPQEFVNRAYARLDRVYDGIWHSQIPQEDYVSVDFAVWIGLWNSARKERIQIQVHRDDAPRFLWRLWWFTVRHTFFMHRGGAFYAIGATFWLIVERTKLFWK